MKCVPSQLFLLNLNLFKEVACVTDAGKVFHSLGDENVNELVQNDVLRFGTINEPFSDDLRFL